MPTLEEFLTPGAQHREGEFTSLGIDELLHKKGSETYPDYTCTHIQHQEHIIEEIEGMERELFDGPYNYAFRNGWNDTKGRMRAVLTSCYFKLFVHLINQGVEYDRDYTLKFLFNLFFHMTFSEDGTKIVMPNDDFRDFQQIFTLLQRGPESILTEDWWVRYLGTLRQKIGNASRNSNYYKKNTTTSKQKWDFIRSKKPAGAYDIDIYNFSPWEYTPCYVTTQPQMTMDNLENKIAYMKCMFLTPDDCENENINCETTSCGGGGRKQRKKQTRKGLRLKIEKRTTRRHR